MNAVPGFIVVRKGAVGFLDVVVQAPAKSPAAEHIQRLANHRSQPPTRAYTFDINRHLVGRFEGGLIEALHMGLARASGRIPRAITKDRNPRHVELPLATANLSLTNALRIPAIGEM